MRRWADATGRVTEYRRRRDQLICKQRYPAQTGYIVDLYANENKADPIERQALEMVFMQKVDDAAAEATAHLEARGTKPSDPKLRDAWTRFLMSLMHRTPERVKYFSAKIKAYEERTLNADVAEKYHMLRQATDPPTYAEWLAQAGPLEPDLRVKLLEQMIDSKRIGETINAMHWTVHSMKNPRHGFISGDHPIMISNGLGNERSFIALPISPAHLFLAAHNIQVINAFKSQRENGLEQACNDACAVQSHHMIIAADDRQTLFIDRRFLTKTAPVGPTGFVTWNAPLIG